jgi:hypothetical protein
MYCIQGHSIDTGKYVIDRQRAIKLIQDAYTKRIQDTLIDSLESRIVRLEDENKAIYQSYNNQVLQERVKYDKQADLTRLENSLKSYYKAESRKYRHQRNLAIFSAGVTGSALIIHTVIQVFKPP